MRVMGLPVLGEFKKAHADARGQVDSWRAEAEKAHWETTQSIKDKYRSADFLSGNRVIFNIKGNSYRLLAQVDFPGEIVLILWIGTHAEYSKKEF